MMNKFPAYLELRENLDGSITLGDKQAEKTRRFSMRAYSGAAIKVFSCPLIFDLEGMKVNSRQKIPILLNHNLNQIAGYGDRVEIDQRQGLLVEGRLSNSSAAGREVSDLSDEGFDWQASMGVNIDRVEYIDEGEKATVNHHKLNGPVFVIRESRVREASFTPTGADENTRGVALYDDKQGFVEVDHKEDTTMSQVNADNQAKDDNALDPARREQVAAEIKKESTLQLSALKVAFPDRSDFVLNQFEKGHTVEQAKAELADELSGENQQLKAQVVKLNEEKTKLQEQNVQLQTGSNTVGFKGEGEPGGNDRVSVIQQARKSFKEDIGMKLCSETAWVHTALRDAGHPKLTDEEKRQYSLAAD